MVSAPGWGPAWGSVGTDGPQVWRTMEHSRPLTTGGAPQGSGLSLPRGSPDDLTAPLPLEHLLKLPLEGLQEFLQDTLARALEDEACPCSCRPPWLSYPGWSRTCPCPGGLSPGLPLSHPLRQ